MAENFKIRTDLVMEEKEKIDVSDTKLKGIIVEEKRNEYANIHVIKLTVLNEQGASILKKPIGTYLTIDAPEMANDSEEYHREISCVLAEYIKELIKPFWHDRGISILVAGLGNRNITPDALGPNVVNNIAIKKEGEVQGQKISISAISPGVMAQTGMETATIIKSIVNETKPNVVICIDALAARNSRRLNTTIQLSDTGIHPGSGVGNHRLAITKETIGTNVIAIGVPTVIDTPTIVYDTLENLLKLLSTSKQLSSVSDTFRKFSEEEKYQLIKELINKEMVDMFVTPKDADETIKRIGYTISEAINIAISAKNM